MGPERSPFLVSEPARLVQDLKRHRDLADIVEQAEQLQGRQLRIGQPDLPSEREAHLLRPLDVRLRIRVHLLQSPHKRSQGLRTGGFGVQHFLDIQVIVSLFQRLKHRAVFFRICMPRNHSSGRPDPEHDTALACVDDVHDFAHDFIFRPVPAHRDQFGFMPPEDICVFGHAAAHGLRQGHYPGIALIPAHRLVHFPQPDDVKYHDRGRADPVRRPVQNRKLGLFIK